MEKKSEFAPVETADTSGVIKVLPNLCFAPGHDKLPHSVNALTVGRQDGEHLKYSVHHYAGAHGQAFGPFGFDQILDFCRHLHRLLADRDIIDIDSDVEPLYLTTASEDLAAHTNASVMLGAYLVLCENWSVEAITDCLGKQEAERKFPCSWGKQDCQANTWIMTVKCCWEGVYVAWQHSWVDLQCLLDDNASRNYRNMLGMYDAAWLVPGQILVSADPVTTAADPNPETFSELWCSPERELERLVSKASMSDSHPCRISSESTVDSISRMESWKCSITSVETVCKNFASTPLPCLELNNAVSFSEFVQECGVKLVIRTNFDTEKGMPSRSYDSRKWSQFDIKHENIRYVDKDGGLPDAGAVASLLLADQSLQRQVALPGGLPGAALIHCKGGFGRSVVLACCLAIYRYDVLGSALLGWARIARPGAITNPMQENFLIGLRGRLDVISLASKSARPSELTEIFQEAGFAPKGKCVGGCTVQ